MKVLISPAKSINENCIFPTVEFTSPLFAKEAKSLVLKLKKLKANDLMELMHVSKDIAELNVNRFKNWHLSNVPSEFIKPAGFLFTGEVYRGLDIATLSDQQLQNAQQSLRILSGMYGLLKPFDLMYPYRLEMGTKIEVKEGVKNLYQFWGDKLTNSLLKEMDKDEAVINLASNEYSKAINWKKVKQPVITPIFKEYKNGEYKIVMMHAKHARGAMARFIIENNLSDPEQLKTYNVDGYSLDVNQSTNTDWVFTR